LKKYIFILISITYLLCSTINNQKFELLSNLNSIQLQFELGEIHIDTIENFTKIRTDSNSETSIVGMPKLPFFSSMIMLDPIKEYSASFEVISSYIIEDVDIIPNQEILDGFEKTEINDINSEFYQSNNSYPITNILLSDPLIMRDLVVASIEVIPFMYYPIQRKLEVFETIIISINEVGDTADIRRRIMPKSKVFENIYSNKIINYIPELRDNHYQQPSILYIGDSSIIDNSTFQQLIDWRRERGYAVFTASTSVTGNTTSSIKNYINNAYDSFDPPPEYVTLIGDVGGSYSIPTYYEDFGHDSYNNQCEGDHPYSQLDGNDLLPEIIIGRMSLRSSSEIAPVVYKILNYEI